MFFVSTRASPVAVTGAAASEMRLHYRASVPGDAIDLRSCRLPGDNAHPCELYHLSIEHHVSWAGVILPEQAGLSTDASAEGAVCLNFSDD